MRQVSDAIDLDELGVRNCGVGRASELGIVTKFIRQFRRRVVSTEGGARDSFREPILESDSILRLFNNEFVWEFSSHRTYAGIVSRVGTCLGRCQCPAQIVFQLGQLGAGLGARRLSLVGDP